jgi:Zn finger protein HypA/HybF involved in hydrogenase expression
VLAVCAVVAGVLLLSIGLAIVEYRRITPLAFRCTRCGNRFQQAPHRDFPRECPACRSHEWAG